MSPLTSHPVAVAVVLGISETGLTLEAQLIDTTASPVGSVITTGFYEIGAGNYLHSASIPDGHRGGIIYRLASDHSILAFTSINPEDTEDHLTTQVPDGYLSGSVGYIIGHIATGEIVFVGPITLGGTMLSFVAGQSLVAEHGSGASWTLGSTDPDLTGSTVTLEIGMAGRSASLNLLATWPTHHTADGTTAQVITLDTVDAATTAALARAIGTALQGVLWATWADDGDRVPLRVFPVRIDGIA